MAISLNHRFVDDVSFLSKWILAHLLAWLVGLRGGIALAFGGGRRDLFDEDHFFVFAILIGIGATISVSRGLVVRRKLPSAKRWVLATWLSYLPAIGVVAIMNGLGLANVRPWSDAVMLALIGASVALPQWWLVRERYPDAAVWTPASITGFLCFLWLTKHPSSSISEFVLLATLAGTASASLTGVVLVWLIDKRPLSI